MKKYVIDKETCQKSIKGVCNGCGGKLEPIETVDNSHNPTFWVGCVKCGKFCNGIEPLYQKIARKLVEQNKLPFCLRIPDKNNKEEYEYYITAQTAVLSNYIEQIHNIILTEELMEQERERANNIIPLKFPDETKLE